MCLLTLVLILFYYLFFFSLSLSPFHKIPGSLSSKSPSVPIRPSSGSLISLWLHWFLFRVARLFFFLRPSELLYPRTLIFGCGAIPGVSGTLEGPSFQNHGPQRTHQTAYAKRESRCRSAGFRRNLGDVLFTCHFISRSLFFQIIISKFCSTTNNSGPKFPLPNNDDRLEICFIF